MTRSARVKLLAEGGNRVENATRVYLAPTTQEGEPDADPKSSPRFHADRAPRRDSHHRHFGRDPVPGVRPGAGEGPHCDLPVECAADRHGSGDVCYGINQEIVSRPQSGFPTPKNLAGIVAPANTYLFMDSGSYIIDPDASHPQSVLNPGGAFWYLPGACGVLGKDPAKLTPSKLSGGLATDCVNSRHSGGLNVAFCDGHAKWLRTEVLLAEARKTAPTLRGAWNPDNP
jgi:prepilin-type processing-associated H-X9-DG protein